MAKECIERNWLRKHMEKTRSSQASFSINSCNELSMFFPVSIVKHIHTKLQYEKFLYKKIMCHTIEGFNRNSVRTVLNVPYLSRTFLISFIMAIKACWGYVFCENCTEIFIRHFLQFELFGCKWDTVFESWIWSSKQGFQKPRPYKRLTLIPGP